jgi:hypothetical protein
MRRAGTQVLCYHRVATGVADPLRLCISPGNFAAHFEEVPRHSVPSTLDEAFSRLPRRRCIVTLDDGEDNLCTTRTIVHRRADRSGERRPITVFVKSA